MLIKFLVIVLVIFFVYLVFFKKSREDQIKKGKDEIDTMVECPTCKTYVSKSDAILSGGKYYCSKECLK